MLIYLIAIFSSYFIFLIILIVGWHKATNSKQAELRLDFVSVVVAIRNEELTISNLIESFGRQAYPKNRFEIILVNDHSTDQTETEIIKLIDQYSDLSIIKMNSIGAGKKKAITTGIETALGEIILTTDADCTLPVDWISGMCKAFIQETQLVIGAVKISTDKTFFSKIQALEFSSVIGSGIALLGWNKPIMCNGASLAFRKKTFFEVGGYEGNFQIPSGDDEFLMRKISQRFPNSIRFVANPECVVATTPQKCIHDFVHQRLRWAGKWKANDSAFAKFVSLIVLIFQISWLVSMGYLIFNSTSIEIYPIIGFKVGLELIFLWQVSSFLRQPFNWAAFLVLQMLYPPYVICIGLLSQIKSYRWKDRTASFSR